MKILIICAIIIVCLGYVFPLIAAVILALYRYFEVKKIEKHLKK